MLKLSDLIIDPATLGDPLWLTEITPCYAYRDGKRTNTISGYKYTVAMPARGLEKISIRIGGPQRIDQPISYVAVGFEGLQLYIYWMDGNPMVGARAKDIHLVDPGSGSDTTAT